LQKPNSKFTKITKTAKPKKIQNIGKKQKPKSRKKNKGKNKFFLTLIVATLIALVYLFLNII
jgi:hypothetical protein